MKKSIIILVALALIIGAGYLSDLVFGQVIQPSGRTYFWQLFDTPNVYTSQAGKGVRVNSVPDGLEFYTISAGGTDEKVGIDSVATTGYIGAASNDGVLRTSSPLTYTDGGDYITFGWALTSQVQGDIAYFDGSNWVRLAKGTAGQVLEMNAGATAPEWDTDDTGGDPVLVNTTAITDGSGVDLTNGTGITITLNAGVSPDTATFAATLGTSISDGEVDNNITIDLATLATTLTITDNESTAENNPVVFVAGAAQTGGSLGLESDGTFYYTPSSGTVTSTTFAGALSGNSTTTTTASAGDVAVDFFGAGVDAVTDGTTCTDIEGTGLSIATGTLNWSAASTDLTDTTDLLYETELDNFSKLQTQISDKTLVNTADGATWSGTHDFGGANLEIPQASPAVPSVDGEIEFDFADGSLVIQHGSAHAELGSPTDVVVGKLIRCWAATIFQPDGVNDVMTVKAINSIEFPHGVVITAIYLGVSENTSYTLTVQNFDDFDTINSGNPTIDAVAYTADTTGEVIDTSPTYDSIAAGQLIMISIPATDVAWIHFEIYYYEPAA